MSVEYSDDAGIVPSPVLIEMVRHAVRTDSSDLYIRAGSPPMYRINGATQAITEQRLSARDTREMAESIMDPDQRSEFRKVSEMNLALSVDELGRFRVNAYVQRNSVAMVLRRIKTEIPELESLGLPPRLKDLSLLKNGLVLVVGATGSGKSTTLAAMIGYRNRMEAGHIVTIEDPVEFLHDDRKSIISQREVGADTDSFANALRSALRQAPDVILIGEMRDVISVESALTFAETGHLVFSTLHSTNAPQTIERLLQFFPPEQHGQIFPSLANNLRAIVAQRLVPRGDGEGRVAVIELMIVTPLIRDYLRRHETSNLKKAIAGGKTDGMQTFDQALFDQYEQGVITSESAIAFADSANDIRLRLRGLSS
ncbi:MAG: PilT/PilU family type 4a pilus ATPase [Chloroflexi bacterium]|nr:PilT/PilU family type 4a pilus ATPase [Chloroflexota bacterium]